MGLKHCFRCDKQLGSPDELRFAKSGIRICDACFDEGHLYAAIQRRDYQPQLYTSIGGDVIEGPSSDANDLIREMQRRCEESAPSSSVFDGGPPNSHN